MPQVPLTPTPIAGGVNTNLNASGDTSSCDFADWHTHTQVINGMFKRVWVYDTTPTLSVQGTASSCPSVGYNYIDCNYTVQVAEELEKASYCSGLYTTQGIQFFSDSVSGGFGVSGTFTTSAVGYTRRKWLVGTDEETLCNKTANCVIGKLPGEYNPTFDTSATIGSHVAQILMHCEQSCPTFNQNLVAY